MVNIANWEGKVILCSWIISSDPNCLFFDPVMIFCRNNIAYELDYFEFHKSYKLLYFLQNSMNETEALQIQLNCRRSGTAAVIRVQQCAMETRPVL